MTKVNPQVVLGTGLGLLFIALVGLNVFGREKIFTLQPSPFPSKPFTENYHTKSFSNVTSCGDVLQRLLIGHWHQNKMTSTEVAIMKRFHKRTRQEEHHIPKGGQRADNKCGNLSIATGGELHWYRALCDPDGPVPCCFNFQCASKSVEECKCPNCFDMRTPIEAKYATWRPAYPECKEPGSMSVEEICELLGTSTLYFMGDSLVRHVYTALLLAINGDDTSGVFKNDTPETLRRRCVGIYMFTEKVCRLWLARRTTACQGAVTLKYDAFYMSYFYPQLKAAVLELTRDQRTRSFVFFGVGFHDRLNFPLVTGKLLNPLLSALKSRKSRWPRLLWAGIHKFGMMRSPLLTVNAQTVKGYNRQVKDFLAPWGVPVFDTFNLTDNVMSFDGQHYGFGINRMKVRILLQYFRQLQQQGLW